MTSLDYESRKKAMPPPSRAVRLLGTDEPPPQVRRLQAGPLSAELEAGNLRYVCFKGFEMIRAISFIVRDHVWGTYSPDIADLTIEENDEAFRISYSATVSDSRQVFNYSARIEGKANGELRFKADGHAGTGFSTNRTGFVILHPLDGVMGSTATVEDIDGGIADTHFPDLIEPYQPMMNLRAITHTFAPGARVTCRMEGDTFEMEDQRNWTDASYKTYCRPLDMPWPYTLKSGEKVVQSVTLSISGLPTREKLPSDEIQLSIGVPVGPVPALGIGIDSIDLEETESHLEQIGTVEPAVAVFRHDPGFGHGSANLAKAAAIGRKLGAELWLQVVVRSLDNFAGELENLGKMISALESPFSTVFVSPAADLSGTLPGSAWPKCPPLSEIYDATRTAIPNARLGGGVFAYFTELNRKRPPLEAIDLVTFQTSAINHAADDRSVMETLEALPSVAATAQAISGEKPFVVGPSGIGVRDNPYNEKRLITRNNNRMETALNDPRQRGLLGAAWTLGFFSRFAYSGAEAITLGGAVGAFGLEYSSQDWVQPFFDDHGGFFPVFHVVQGITALHGMTLRSVEISEENRILALAAESAQGLMEVWIANLCEDTCCIRINSSLNFDQVFILDDGAFVNAAFDADYMDHGAESFTGSVLTVGPYAVTRLVGMKET